MGEVEIMSLWGSSADVKRREKIKAGPTAAAKVSFLS